MVNKTIVIGDIHGRNVWKKIVEHEDADKIIFIGDYFDSRDGIPVSDQINNFVDILNYKKNSGKEVIMLIGNHDFHYMRSIDETYSGYNAGARPAIEAVLEENKEHLQIAYQDGEFLFSHAGVSSVFLDQIKKYLFIDEIPTDTIAGVLNMVFKAKPFLFGFGKLRDSSFNLNPYGDNKEQSPIWIRPRSLFKANHDTLRTEVIQVVGHTQVERMDIDGKATGNRYFLIDCLGTSGQYLIIENNKVTSNSYKNYEKI